MSGKTLLKVKFLSKVTRDRGGGKSMITIFNRRFLIATMDMKRQSDIRDKLSGAGIAYTVGTKNLQSSEWLGGGNRGRYGSMGIQQKYSYEYKIYVHKDDYERALKEIQ